MRREQATSEDGSPPGSPQESPRGSGARGSLAGAVLVGAGIGLPLGAWMTPDLLRFGIFVAGSGLLGGWIDRLRTRPGRGEERIQGSGSSLRHGLVVVSVGAVFALGILWIREPFPPISTVGASGPGPPSSVALGELPLESVRHRVRPPRYTGREPWEGRGLEMTVPAHSDVAWRVRVSEPVERVSLETAGGGAPFREERPGQWVFQRRVHRETEIRLRIVANGGDVHAAGPWQRVEVIPDHPPTARFVAPSGPTVRDPGAPGSLRVEATVSDDYEVAEAVLVGKLTNPGDEDEAEERRWPLRDVGDGARGADGSRVVEAIVDLGNLDPSPGSELFLRVEVVDNRLPRPQRSRSEARVVRFEPPA